MGVTIHDVASSHGTLGFITELRLLIRPIINETLIGGIAEFSECNAFGEALIEMIERKSPVRYGETISHVYEDVRGDLKPPLYIIEVPEEYESEIMNLMDFKPLDSVQLANMKDFRINMAKLNPNEGIQFSLFEGYGFYDRSLRKLQDSLDEIDALLIKHDMIPFAKYGHGPSKWYLGNNTPTYGLILHSNEIKPEGKTRQELLNTVVAIVNKCDELGITPKPEHKWPYSDETKKVRLQELRSIIGNSFNSFMFEQDCAFETLSSMV